MMKEGEEWNGHDDDWTSRKVLRSLLSRESIRLSQTPRLSCLTDWL